MGMTSKQKNSRKAQLLREYGSCCCWCGRLFTREQLTIEHLIPQSLGGSDSRENLMLACFKCNNSRSDDLLPPRNRNPTLFSIIFAAIVTACQSDQEVDIEKRHILISLLKEECKFF